MTHTDVAPRATDVAPRSGWSWKTAVPPLTVAGITAAGTTLIALNNPHVSDGGFGVCPLFAATGLYCPGCGGTRAVYDLAHGDVLGAMSMNPMFTLAVPLLGVLWLRWFLRGQGMTFKPWPFPTWAGIALPAVLVMFAILRNIHPFSQYLSP